jgi:hypothetical protein
MPRLRKHGTIGMSLSFQGQNANNTREAFLRKRVRTQLSADERKFLLSVQRSDISATKRYVTKDSNNSCQLMRSHAEFVMQLVQLILKLLLTVPS